MGARQMPLCWPVPLCSVSGYSSVPLVFASSGHASARGSLFVPDGRRGQVSDRCAQFTRQMAAAQDGLYARRLLYLAAAPDAWRRLEHCQGRADIGLASLTALEAVGRQCI